MRLWRWVRGMFGADAMVLPRSQPKADDDRAARERLDRVMAKGHQALERRRNLDAEVSRVEQYLRDRQR